MGDVTWKREILQLMPAIPGQFFWYYFESNGTPYAAPVVAWALVKETRSWKGDKDDEDDEETETVVHPLVQQEDALGFGFGEVWDSPVDASNSIGLWSAANISDEALKKAVADKLAQNARDLAAKTKPKA